MTCTKKPLGKKEAKRALRSCQLRRRPENRVYFCDQCKSYHLTSEPLYSTKYGKG